MIKYFLIALPLLFTVFHLKSQTELKFDKRFVECEDRWIAFQMDKDSSYSYGFIYIDSQAGLTFNLEGSFTISTDGRFIPKKIENTSIKVRLQPNNVLVTFIPVNKYEELEIEPVPDWLKYYKTDTASVDRLYRWGFMYNAWGECAKALTYLEKAKEINSKYPGLEVELGFSYNCLGQYDKAIIVLSGALESDPANAYINKEYVYALSRSGQLDKAAESCQKALKICPDKTYRGEMCFNLLQAYYKKKDKENFNLWLKKTKKFNAKNDFILKIIKQMENELK